MADIGNLHRVPLFVKAKKPEQLVVLMHKNNMKHGKEYNYTITHDGSNWFGWYNEDLMRVIKNKRNKAKLAGEVE